MSPHVLPRWDYQDMWTPIPLLPKASSLGGGKQLHPQKVRFPCFVACFLSLNPKELKITLLIRVDIAKAK